MIQPTGPMPTTAQLELPFALAEVQGQTHLTVNAVAERLGCTDRHVLNLIESGDLVAIDIRRRCKIEADGSTRTLGRQRLRIPVEAYRDFVLRSMTAPFSRSPLRDLPVPALLRFHRELTNHLRAKGALARS